MGWGGGRLGFALRHCNQTMDLQTILVRFPEIKMVSPKKGDRVRDDLSDETINRYFSLLETTLDDLKIKNIPKHI